MVKQMIFWGGTGQAKVLRECMRKEPIKLIAVFDNSRKVNAPFDDVPLISGRDGFEKWLSAQCSEHGKIGFLVAIGGFHGRARLEMQQYLLDHGLTPLTAVHASAAVADDAKIAAGCQVLMQASVASQAVLEEGCIVNTSASVDHECRLGRGVHICPGATLAGCVVIGDCASVGSGAVILPRVRIGAGAIVGAGAVVLHDVEPFTVVVGNPAKVIRTLNPDGSDLEKR